MFSLSKISGCVLLAAGLVASSATVSHAIDCNEGAQVMKDGSEIVTPFCQDNYLAEVAQSYGLRVSARKIRNSPSTKEEVCRVVGHDIRVAHNCQHLLENGRRYRR